MIPFNSVPNYDPNYIPTRPVVVGIREPQIRNNGTTKIRDYDPSLRGITGASIPPKSNHFKFRFNSDNREPGDVFTWMKHEVIPEGFAPRSRADGGEYHQSIQNNRYFRREDFYELNNTIIHPTHYDEISPERLARDPNGVIHNWYNGWYRDIGDYRQTRAAQYSHNRAQAKMNMRRKKQQLFDFVDNGDLERTEEFADVHDF